MNRLKITDAQLLRIRDLLQETKPTLERTKADLDILRDIDEQTDRQARNSRDDEEEDEDDDLER